MKVGLKPNIPVVHMIQSLPKKLLEKLTFTLFSILALKQESNKSWKLLFAPAFSWPWLIQLKT